MTETLDRSKPPINTALPNFKFPAFTELQLSFGGRLFVVEDHSQPLVNCTVLLKKGAAMEPVAGLAQIAARMMTRGTEKRNATQIAEELEFLGAAMNFSAQWDSTVVNVTSLGQYFETALEICADCILNSTTPEEELERVRRQSLAELQQDMADPEYLASLAFSMEFFKNHPYGHPRRGTEETLQKITRDECAEWNRSVFKTQPHIIISGDITPEEAQAVVEKLFKAWEITQKNEEKLPAVESFKKRSIVLIEKPEALQTVLQLGQRAVHYSDEDYTAVRIINTIFGGYFLSRANALLREKHGFTYGAHSYLELRKWGTAMILNTSVGNDVTKEALKVTIAELQRLQHEAITADELFSAVQYTIGSFVRSVETPQQVANLLQNILLHELPFDFYERFCERLATLTPDELFAVQQRWISPDNLVIAASGNVEFLKGALAEFGEVKVLKDF
ncbi:MAG TPA: pitrilysin family protein [Patescibacteria group bacterium]|nr:pitrilysin family protein [Patescibacteria group bacterium]